MYLLTALSSLLTISLYVVYLLYLPRRDKADVDLGLAPMRETLISVDITNFQKACHPSLARAAASTASCHSLYHTGLQPPSHRDTDLIA